MSALALQVKIVIAFTDKVTPVWFFRCISPSRKPSTSSQDTGAVCLQTWAYIQHSLTYRFLHALKHHYLICLIRDSANHILSTAAEEWIFSMLGSSANSALEDVLVRAKASSCTCLTRGAHLWEPAHCNRTFAPNTSGHTYSCFLQPCSVGSWERRGGKNHWKIIKKKKSKLLPTVTTI